MKNKLITLVTLIVLINRGQAQNTDYLGVRLFNGPGGVLFTNSEGKTLEYNKRLTSGWGVQYGHQSGSFMVEAGGNYHPTDQLNVYWLDKIGAEPNTAYLGISLLVYSHLSDPVASAERMILLVDYEPINETWEYGNMGIVPIYEFKIS